MMPLPIKIIGTLFAWSMLSGLWGVCAIFLEDRKNCYYSFAAVVSQISSFLIATISAVIYALIKLWLAA